MIDHEAWLALFVPRVRQLFGQRLRFVGLQGSYNRGEATEQSDIDLVVVLDQVEVADLRAYRQLVAGMPDAHLACGFIGGWQQLLDWPAHELFHFCRDTRSLYGSLGEIASRATRQDAAAAVRLGASALYHGACHCYVYEEEPALCLEGLYKGVFYVLQAAHYCRTGRYAATKGELLPLLAGEEHTLLESCIHRGQLAQGEEGQWEGHYQRLIGWSAAMLAFE